MQAGLNTSEHEVELFLVHRNVMSEYDFVGLLENAANVSIRKGLHAGTSCTDGVTTTL